MKKVLFVCEHGSAKSVVAGAHFNKLAEKAGLALRAISRGTDPDAANHPAALMGLTGDELVPGGEPQKLSRADLVSAHQVIAFAALPEEYADIASVDVWTVPPVSEDYALSRDAIVTQLNRLILELHEAEAGSDKAQ